MNPTEPIWNAFAGSCSNANSSETGALLARDRSKPLGDRRRAAAPVEGAIKAYRSHDEAQAA
jgi:hypothetical protein